MLTSTVTNDLVSAFWVGIGGRDFTLTGLEPNGLGGAAPLWSVPIPTLPTNSCDSHAASVGDFEGDGVDELVACSATTLEVRRWAVARGRLSRCMRPRCAARLGGGSQARSTSTRMAISTSSRGARWS